MTFFKFIASGKLAVVGMLLLGVMLFALHDKKDFIWMLSIPFAMLALNLLAAIIMKSGLRKSRGMFVFHMALLLLLLLAAFGRLSRFEAELEIVEGGAFNINNLNNVIRGPLHFGGLEQLSFMQGKYSVEYEDDLQRGVTYSEVLLPDLLGRSIQQFVGDDKPLYLDGYKFYTTSNKGFAVILTWIPESGQALTGALHLPSFPKLDWNQVKKWGIPGTNKNIKIELQLPQTLREQLKQNLSWKLQSHSANDGWLEIYNGAQLIKLDRGQQVSLAKGTLRFDEVRGWMGYKVYYDPTLSWLFFIAVCGISGLLWHYRLLLLELPLQIIKSERVLS